MNTARDREHVLEQWLKQSGGARAAPTAECLDAETAGAWADGRLGGGALAEAQLHVADCARCQALMATLLRTTPAQVAAALAPKRGWLAWAMPLAAAAVILVSVVVWQNAPAPKVQVDQIDVCPMTPPEGVPRKPDARRPAPARGKTAFADKEPAASAPNEKPRAAAAASDQVSRPKENPGAPTVRGDSAQRSFNEEPRVAAQPAVQPPQPALAPEPQTAGAATAARDSAAVQAETRRETAASTDRLLARPAPPPGSSIQVLSPNRAVQWRVTGDLVERTTDGGSTWSTAGALGSITSGSAPSAQVCWLAGRGGLVVRTTDGVNWSRLPFPETVDLVAVGAVSAQTATVTAADGRVFATANGGQYWLADR